MEKMLTEQKSFWQLSIVNEKLGIPLKFGPNRINNTWYIADTDIELEVLSGGGCVGGEMSFSSETQLMLC